MRIGAVVAAPRQSRRAVAEAVAATIITTGLRVRRPRTAKSIARQKAKARPVGSSGTPTAGDPVMTKKKTSARAALHNGRSNHQMGDNFFGKAPTTAST
jgi:hypothetical protein